MKSVDSHCHLDFEQFDGDREKVIEDSRKKLEFIVNAGSNLEHNRSTIKLNEEYGDFVVPILGLHPYYSENFDQLEKIKNQIREKDPVAIGEIGLDHHHIQEEEIRERQEEVFRELLELAEDLQKPVVIHSRDAEEKAVKILKEYDLPDVMLHCFNGSPEIAEDAIYSGMTIGITTQVLYSNRVQNIVEEINYENILLETDSPYLYRGDRNQPVNVLESAEKIAEIKSEDKKEIIKSTSQNAKRFFGKN